MKGFSLIELLAVLAIISILATLAYPSYQANLYKTRRSDGHIALLSLANAMEVYYLNHQSYLGAESLKNLRVEEISPQGYYQLSFTTPTSQSYVLSATPLSHKPQASDPCGTLTLSHKNEKGGDALNCW